MIISIFNKVLIFKKEYLPLIEYVDEEYVFTSSEEIWLLYHIIQNISFDPVSMSLINALYLVLIVLTC